MGAHEAEEACRDVAATTLAAHAADVDREARFPAECFAELRARELLLAALPKAAGGLGASVPQMAAMAAALARGCGSTALIWAMHQIQLACVLAGGSQAAVERAARGQRLIASVTSERGTGGSLRTSRCAVLAGDDGALTVDKHATTVSYGLHAGAYLITARRAPGAHEGDQVAVLADAAQVRAEPAGAWNPLGMRGTCSPPLRVSASFTAADILDRPFAQLAEQVMTPLSHVLWAAVWTGLAREAAARAVRFHRSAGTDRADPRLGEMRWRMTALESQLADTAELAELLLHGRECTAGDLTRLNALKLAASEVTTDVAMRAMRICGMAGYSEEGPFSVARPVRDLLSAPLMINNVRLTEITAALALVSGDR
ncbi:acyl-CoA dehydrogenase family protein [Spirillospora sp. NPDC050679]